MKPLLDTHISYLPPPDVEIELPLQLQIAALDYSSYVGRIAIGRIRRGTLRPGQQVMVMHGEVQQPAKIAQVLGFQGLERVPFDNAEAGDIVAVTGIDDITI